MGGKLVRTAYKSHSFCVTVPFLSFLGWQSLETIFETRTLKKIKCCIYCFMRMFPWVEFLKTNEVGVGSYRKHVFSLALRHCVLIST